MSENAKWYVIHTYSGYENAVKTSMRNSVNDGTGGYDPRWRSPWRPKRVSESGEAKKSSARCSRLCAYQNGHDG